MKIQDVLNKNVMLFDLQATDKEGVINEMVQSLVDNGVVTDFETFKIGIMNREAQTSTGLGEGIAMPHSKNEAVKEATVLFAKSNKGVDYASLDGQPTDLFFMIAAPEGANDTHLAALAELSKYLMKPGFAEKLRQVSTPDQVIAAFDAEEQEAAAEEAKKQKLSKKQLHLTNRSLLPLQHVQLVSPTLTWQKKPSSKKGKKWVLQSVLKQTGHPVSATV